MKKLIHVIVTSIALLTSTAYASSIYTDDDGNQYIETFPSKDRFYYTKSDYEQCPQSLIDRGAIKYCTYTFAFPQRAVFTDDVNQWDYPINKWVTRDVLGARLTYNIAERPVPGTSEVNEPYLYGRLSVNVGSDVLLPKLAKNAPPMYLCDKKTKEKIKVDSLFRFAIALYQGIGLKLQDDPNLQTCKR